MAISIEPDWVAWAKANDLDPASVVKGSVDVKGDWITYDSLSPFPGGGWTRVPKRSPLLVPLDDFWPR